MSDKLLTTKDVAEALGLQPGTVENWRLQGKGPPFVKIGHLVRYPEDRFREWVDEQTKEAS